MPLSRGFASWHWLWVPIVQRLDRYGGSGVQASSLVHVTEARDDKRVNVITDVATAVSSADSQALPGMDEAARLHRVTLVGPLPLSISPQHRARDGFGRENGQVSGNWRDLPAAEPTSVVVRFDTPPVRPLSREDLVHPGSVSQPVLPSSTS